MTVMPARFVSTSPAAPKVLLATPSSSQTLPLMLPAGARATVATALPVSGPEVPRLRPVEVLSSAE